MGIPSSEIVVGRITSLLWDCGKVFEVVRVGLVFGHECWCVSCGVEVCTSTRYLSLAVIHGRSLAKNEQESLSLSESLLPGVLDRCSGCNGAAACLCFRDFHRPMGPGLLAPKDMGDLEFREEEEEEGEGGIEEGCRVEEKDNDTENGIFLFRTLQRNRR